MSKVKILIVIFVLILGLLLRLHNYSVYPQRGATSDEYAYAFLGISLLTQQQPVGWSAIPLYKPEHLTINKLYFPIVKPYMDHPPLYGLLVGGWALLFNQDRFQEVTLPIIRLIPVLLAVISSIFLFLLANRLYGFKIGIWSLLIYSTGTVYVVNNRAALAETLISPFLLCSVYFLSFKNFQRRSLQLGVLAGFALLTKVLGVVVFLTTLYFFFIEKVKRIAVIKFFLVFLFFIFCFLLYGWYFGKDLFWEIQAFQGKRLLGTQTLWTLIGSPIIVNKVIFDGWYYFGVFSLFFLFSDFPKHKHILIPSLIYILLLVLSVAQTDIHGWYIVPLFPFFAIASAYLMHYIIEKKSLLVFIFLLLVGLGTFSQLLQNTFGIAPLRFRILTLITLLPGIFLLLDRKRLFSYTIQWWFYLILICTALVTFQYIHPS